MHKLVVHYGLKMGKRPAKAEENLMNAQYNCVLYDGSDYKCTELLCNKAAPAAIAQQKPPENTCRPQSNAPPQTGVFYTFLVFFLSSAHNKPLTNPRFSLPGP
ncbi:MAG: hypothetical protein ACLUFF_00670 [Acutalibacteraceae bacterium]